MPGLGRIPQFDERSRAYPVRTLLGDTPREPVHRVWRCNAYLDQGREGSCVGFAFTHELAAEPLEVPVTPGFARSVYLQAQRIDEWPGGAYPDAKPFYEGTSVLAGVQVLLSRGFIPEYRWAFGLDDLVDAVGHVGPAVIGVNWYTGMFTPNPATLFIQPTGRLSGGHAIMVRGVNPTRELFILHNSWGTRWGRWGQCFISFADMERLLGEQGDACIPITRRLGL